jgi:hypothetical protein
MRANEYLVFGIILDGQCSIIIVGNKARVVKVKVGNRKMERDVVSVIVVGGGGGVSLLVLSSVLTELNPSAIILHVM